MSDTPHVVGVVGSLRDGSYTRLGVDRALDGVRRAGGTAELLDLREYDLPTYDADRDEAGDANAFKTRVREAEAVVLGTPMYHGSYSSTLKTALDYCGFEEFEDKTVGLLAVAGGGFPVTALEHLRSVCRALNAWVIPHQVAVPRAHAQFEDGDLLDEDLDGRALTLGRRAVQYADIEPDPDSFEGDQNVGAR
ncbi:NADPH-dependent FMN reductase [Halorubrum kocurii]|uniref:NADPH-dependent FMN reductase n=1 Tax=Halorubrum kocurii JCM 14978 TaxID=1230456 RepID=M0NN82_9EURY|nr:NAD(P)H-dependent oxidoreductase [Halorubrum kocurii]EMA59038.1 NADPH-dependent FMN reductase [Halorubrum kocurii JCM 14978]